jgi:thymidylate kinase
MIVGIEGPCCAGKTTLSRGLLAHYGSALVQIIPDYSDFAGGGKNLPPPVPTTLAEERSALERFEQLERDRIALHLKSASALVLIDRCIYTLFAHCHSLTRQCGADYLALAEDRFAHSDAPLWPDTIIYIDTPLDSILERNRGKFPAGSIFIDKTFNETFRSFFLPALKFKKPPVTLFCVDGRKSPAEIAAEVILELNQRREASAFGTARTASDNS